jgi:glycosyltransferase involved in cell wall biosynthesis
LKKLLICSPSHALRGGVETIVNDLCRELPGRGWDAILALGKGARFNDIDAYRNTYPDLPIIEIDGTKGTRQARLDSLNALMEQVRPDAVLSARIFDAYEAVARLGHSHLRPRLIAAIRAFEPQYLFDARTHRDCIDLFAADGNLLSAALVDWCGIEPSRVVSIPGGVRAPSVQIEPRKLRDRVRIGYVGRLEQGQKRIFDLVPFLLRLDETGIPYSLTVVGSGPDEAELKSKLNERVASGRVVFCGWQSHEVMYSRFFPEMDCLVHFAHTEGVTIAPREAMAHGVVPIISEFFGLMSERQFVDEGNCLTFLVGDVNSAVGNIGRLVSEPGLLEKLSINAINSQSGKYTFAGSMDAWVAALDQCLEQPIQTGQPPDLGRPADGRLARIGISPRTAQRIRDLVGKRHFHSDAGSEWPTGSGLMTDDTAEEIWQFGRDYEKKIKRQRELSKDSEASCLAV